MAVAFQLRYRPGASVVRLDDDRATDATVTGSKGARLAQATRAGLPVLPGFVLTVDGTSALSGSAAHPELAQGDVETELREAWAALSDAGRIKVVARSSSPHEDTDESSMAGMFHSEVDLSGWEAFLAAVHTVIDSAKFTTASGVPAMAVLVQRHLDPPIAGVLFGVDPVTGDPEHRVAVAVAGGPQALVSGETEGTTHTMTAGGRLRSVRDGEGGSRLGRRDRRALVALERRARTLFGSPQDIEWAIDGNDVWMLQSRPVTAVSDPAVGPVYGTGPLAETFPDALAPLEQDLWLQPLEEGLREALLIVGVTSLKRLSGPLVVAPGGWAAIDLEAIGAVRARGVLAKLDPRPGYRRLRSSWRVGRTKAALGRIVDDLIQRADHALGAVPPVGELDDPALLRLLERGHEALRSLHGHEMLAGMLHGDGGSPTGLELALRALGDGRALGDDDAQLRALRPEVLALTAPRIGPPAPLPTSSLSADPITVDDLPPREALRLRIRWVHELLSLAALELGARLTARGQLPEPAAVARLRREELVHAIETDTFLDVPPAPTATTAPPARFRLTSSGATVAAAADGATGQGAGGGRGSGPVHLGADPPQGAVLVTRTLDPGLAPLLPRLAGLVAETGSPLSHLAILAREHGVPTVVGYAGATTELAPGVTVIVDGGTGTVEQVPIDLRADA